MSDDFGVQMRAAADAAAARSARPPVTAVRRRLTRRRWATGTGVTVVVALAVVAGANALEPPSAPAPVTSPTPSASVDPGPTASPVPASESPSPTPPAAPTTIVASRGQEDEARPLVLLSAVTGRVLRSVAVDPGDGAMGRPVVSYDRKTVYFARRVTSCTAEVVAVPTQGGAETVVGNGYDPAISPDGRSLAYRADADVCADESLLVVRDLRTGAERRWRAGGGTGTDVVAMAWSPDSRHLAVVRELQRRPEDVRPESGAAGYVDRDLWVLDTRAPGTTVVSGRRVPGVDGLVARVAYRGPEGALLVLRVPSHGDGPSALFQVDPASGREREVVAFPGAVYEFDYDASGRHLLFVWHDTLYRWAAGRHGKIADRVNGADW